MLFDLLIFAPLIGEPLAHTTPQLRNLHKQVDYAKLNSCPRNKPQCIFQGEDKAHGAVIEAFVSRGDPVF
jgi:hypothetical protein